MMIEAVTLSNNVPAIRHAVEEDIIACAAILNDWIDATHWMPRVHDHDDVLRHYREDVFTKRTLFVAQNNAILVGFMALSNDDDITALYIAETARNKGIGKAMIDRAKQERPQGLKLWTFVANTKAQNFYKREGFVECRRTNGDNEENLPDILFTWQAAVPRA